jgi:MtN3 and saliva related transmembrane protein
MKLREKIIKEKYDNDVPDDINQNENTGTFILGIFAGLCTTFGFLPAVIRVLKNKIKSPISTSTLVLSFLGNITWIIYSVIVKDWVLSVFTSISVVFFGILLLSQCIYKDVAKLK